MAFKNSTAPGVRLQKVLAEAGIASRRACERVIMEGRVSVNGHAVRELGIKVDPSHDRVAVDGRPIKSKRKLYVAVNKPAGYLCTRRDPEKRNTVGELLPREWHNLYPVGRLDYASEGLIFLTNDGEFCLRLTHPRYGVRKIYRVTVESRADRHLLARMMEGVMDHGERMKVDKARIITANNSHSLLELELTEGKNREIRRLLWALDLNIERLQRIRIGPIKLGELPAGKWRTLTETEIESLLSVI